MDEAGRRRIDETLRDWRQGDCVLGKQWFLFRLDIDAPPTDEAAAAADENADTGVAEVLGFMVATQTCDLVRECDERPFVEVCPLVKVDSDLLDEIHLERRPNHAFVPGVADHGLVADLDRVMTVEKAVVAGWERTAGCRSDNEVRSLSRALARKRSRAAFPDDFNEFAKQLTKYLTRKHDKDSEPGRALRALREIRVHAAPSWDAEDVALTFLFIRNDEEPGFDLESWDQHRSAWMDRLFVGGRFTSIDGVVQTLDDLTAREYIESDRLDLDHLSA